MREEERLESYILCSIKGIGAASMKKLLQEAGTVEKIRHLPDERLKKVLGEERAECFKWGMDEHRRRAAERRYYHMKEQGIFFLPLWDGEYPVRLKAIADAPLALYGKGSLPDNGKKAVAIVGARSCSVYGRETARYFASGLAGEGVVIVSGMARGIDGIAQLAALDADGCSTAVLGCGVDICYPPENRRLYDRLEKEGCLLSEYPPGTEPQARLFPPRNRIISGLSDLILVTEAGEKSGTLITVDMALEQGRDVFAVPGRITDRCSRGCNELIRNGAGLATGIQTLLQELEIGRRSGHGRADYGQENDRRQRNDRPQNNDGFMREKGQSESADSRTLAQRILAVLDYTPKSLDEISAGIAMDGEGEKPLLQELMQELIVLCTEGKAGRIAGQYFAGKME